MHTFTNRSGGGHMIKIELLLYVLKELILNNEYHFFRNMFKSFKFVMQLNQNRFGRHFPVHAKGFFSFLLGAGYFYPKFTQRLLS